MDKPVLISFSFLSFDGIWKYFQKVCHFCEYFCNKWIDIAKSLLYANRGCQMVGFHSKSAMINITHAQTFYLHIFPRAVTHSQNVRM